MRPKDFTPELETSWRLAFQAESEKCRAQGEEAYFAVRWLIKFLDQIKAPLPVKNNFCGVHWALLKQGADPWLPTLGLIRLSLKATAHKRA